LLFEFSVFLFYREVIDTGIALTHVSVFVELPVLIAICPEPLPFSIMIFIFKPHSHPVFAKAPKFFFELVVQFSFPFASKKFFDLLPAIDKVGPVSPLCIYGIGKAPSPS
jgi:hypothetical protein